MSSTELEKECQLLEDAYAEALKDEAEFDVLNRLWARIQLLRKKLAELG